MGLGPIATTIVWGLGPIAVTILWTEGQYLQLLYGSRANGCNYFMDLGPKAATIVGI